MRSFAALAWIALAVSACDPLNQPMAHPQVDRSPALDDAGAGEGGAAPVSPAPTITASPSDIEI